MAYEVVRLGVSPKPYVFDDGTERPIYEVIHEERPHGPTSWVILLEKVIDGEQIVLVTPVHRAGHSLKDEVTPSVYIERVITSGRHDRRYTLVEQGSELHEKVMESWQSYRAS